MCKVERVSQFVQCFMHSGEDGGCVAAINSEGVDYHYNIQPIFEVLQDFILVFFFYMNKY